ncbi:hypothetical protein [Enterococcus saccharolyticus]|uniref:hypothetical protein n=1 Tax=Enterococcus saccharolyticus TaxID=41997 RepID=UPI0039DFF9D5
MEHNFKEVSVKANLFKEVNVFINDTKFDDSNVLRVVKDQKVTGEDEATYAKLIGSEFQDGVIEVQVLSRLLPDAPEHARGFIGMAFRIDEQDTEFESFYVRPTNSRCDIQLRRNRTVQYFSYPNFKYFHSRETNPGEYESYVDIGLDEWIDLKLVVEGAYGKLYINKAEQPALIVNDMKHGANAKGALGFFVDIGTEGFFRNLRYTPSK